MFLDQNRAQVKLISCDGLITYRKSSRYKEKITSAPDSSRRIGVDSGANHKVGRVRTLVAESPADVVLYLSILLKTILIAVQSSIA